MSSVPQQRTGAGPAHSATGDRPGWGPTPRSRRSYSARPDGRALMALRATTYVLTSLASVVFLLLAGYGVAQYLAFQDAFSGFGPVALDEVEYARACEAGLLAPAECPDR